jgi:ElaB/YqjD/DUF883 family membrane-anchored ribosome-binding protein
MTPSLPFFAPGRFVPLRRLAAVALVACGGAVLGGCSAAYYATMEQFGVEKREILVDRVGDASKAQEEAKEQFSSALDRFRAIVDFDGGDLEKMYDRLDRDFERSEDRAEAVRERVKSVEDVAADLFKEWRKELDQYTSAELRAKSQATLAETEDRYADLERVMRRSVASMEPVLGAMRDQVLFLKHNLNARAIGGLEGTVDELQGDVGRLIDDMDASIAEAQAFIREMGAA